MKKFFNSAKVFRAAAKFFEKKEALPRGLAANFQSFNYFLGLIFKKLKILNEK